MAAFGRGKAKSGADIAHCDGYAWNQRDRLGKGSYGEVYKGWRESVRGGIGRPVNGFRT